MENVFSSKVLTTRRGTIGVGIGIAALAGIVLLVYLNQYRNNVDSQAKPVSVLVAKGLIQKGTPGEVIGTQRMYQVSSVPQKQLVLGAFVDPATLKGRVAAVDIYPGQQIRASDFTIGETAPLLSSLAGPARAVSVPLDAARTVGGQLVPGDHVDVYVGMNAQIGLGPTRPIVKLVMQDVYVLNVGPNITLRATPKGAALLAFASMNATIWLSLRPTTGAPPVAPPAVDAKALLLGVPPLRVSK